QGSDNANGSQAGNRGGIDYGRPGAFGDPRNGWAYGGWDGGRWRNLDAEDIRQFRGEIRQWTNEAQDLRRRLLADNLDPKELDDILRKLRQLDDDRVYKDPSELQRLQSFVTEGLKHFE